jgi:hypothetical protein
VTPTDYRIAIRGRFSERFLAAFDTMATVETRDGVTVLVGQVRDQAELYGVLTSLRDLGVELVSVEEAR